ncbi:TPA: thermosome subunit, partial [Candidatus Woesearchaeota archaeon]|nr:thermosome subunit [Candidatus Woesearchaeota archaeon]
ITNDGVTILDEMDIEHPAAKMMLEIAKVQESEIGDGTTSAVIIGGELLKNAEELLDKNIHPTVIANGYKLAAEKAQEILPKLGKNVTPDDVTALTNIAITAMTGKNVEMARDKLAHIAVEAVLKVMEKTENSYIIDTENIKIEKKEGAGITASQLVNGIVLDKERVHTGMPRLVKSAKIALLECAIEAKETGTEAKIQLTDPRQLQAFLEHEERALKDMVEKIISSGANVVFCQKGIDDLAQHFLAKKSIFAVRRVKKSDMEKLSRATGAKIVSSWKELTSDDLGFAGFVHEKKVAEDMMLFIEQCHNPKAVTLLVKGATEHVAEESKRAVIDALGDVRAVLHDGLIVGGAGAVEVELAQQLRRYAATLRGREQLAVMAFADALEVIPRTLAENAGLDPIDVLVALRSAHDQGQRWAGVNVFTGLVLDAWAENVVEPLKIKTQALSSATEVAEMILRIDDVIMGAPEKNANGREMPLFD